MSTLQQIIAMGGGGFSSEPDNLALDVYLLQQAQSERPRVLLVPTASGDSDSYIGRFYSAFSGLPCRPQHLPLFRRRGSLRDAILSHDIIYVGGGNTKSMLALWREWELPELLREACEQGSVLAGLSAGAICWFEQGVTDSLPDRLSALDCLGFIGGSCCPHYDGEADRRPAYAELLKSGEIEAGLALDDGVAAHFIDGELKQVVTSRPDAGAYHVQWNPAKNAAEETPIQPKVVLDPVKPTWPTH